MEALKIEDLSFRYPGSTEYALRGIDISLSEGEVLCLCGQTGCGKTTLLRNLKQVIAPAGELKGEITISGVPAKEMSAREQTKKIGFVMQDPENQIVTDMVWHELAFGLENLGEAPAKIRLKTAEAASFFGIESWLGKRTSELSGGQKQILDLAAVMVMSPDILVLDEPTARLDPVAASEFLSAVRRVNKELGTTVIISEHRLDDVLPMADRMAVMRQGEIVVCGTVPEAIKKIPQAAPEMEEALPQVTRAYLGVQTAVHNGINAEQYKTDQISEEADGQIPLDVAAGRAWISEMFAGYPADGRDDAGSLSGDAREGGWHRSDGVLAEDSQHQGSAAPAETKETVAQLKGVWFAYTREEDAIRGIDLTIHKGETVSILGGNGAGKSTLLSLISGTVQPFRGKVRTRLSRSKLPQQPQLLFTEETVAEEIEKKGCPQRLTELFKLEHLSGRHPYDLSGGEMQRLALCEVLGMDADIVLLDEPTKGLDPEYKVKLAGEIGRLKEEGKAVVVVSHDTEFCARVSDRCIMMAAGEIVADAGAAEFFAGNDFYTTKVNRMARHISTRVLLPEDLCR